MQIYYFSRTGRSKMIAEQLGERYGTEVREIEDHQDWMGRENYKRAAAMSLAGQGVLADYVQPDVTDDIIVVFPLWAGAMPPGVKTFVDEVHRENIIAVVTSLGSTLVQRDGFKEVIDLVGREISASDIPYFSNKS